LNKYFDVIIGTGKEANIFLPGTGWSGDFGAPIAESLSNRFITHMIDLPGIGKSKGLEGVVKLRDAAKWLDGYIEEKGLRNVNIIGHSLGGIIGLSYAYYYPDKVKRLILLDIGYAKVDRFPVKMMGPVGYFMPIISALHNVFGQKVLGKDTVPAPNTQPNERTDDQIQKVIVRLELEDTLFIRKAIQNQPDVSVEGISLLLSAYRFNLPNLVKKLKVPCLLLYGNRDHEPIKIQKSVNSQVIKLEKMGIQVEELKGGHYAHASDPKANKLISAFLL
jgi:2-hydroxy-6-oxonona-2,4-dienedioate hydrolase